MVAGQIYCWHSTSRSTNVIGELVIGHGSPKIVRLEIYLYVYV